MSLFSCVHVVGVCVSATARALFYGWQLHVHDIHVCTVSRFLGRMPVGSPAVERNVFLVPLLYIAGTCHACLCLCALAAASAV